MMKASFATFRFLLLTHISCCLALAAASTTHSCSIVTGANGYVGREIVREILKLSTTDASQDEIICLVRPNRIENEKSYWTKESCVKVMPYDMLDGGETLSNALQSACQVEHDDATDICVYHVASVFGPTENHEQTALENVRGTEDVVKTIAAFAGNSGTPKLVLTSSMAAVRASGQIPLNGKYYTALDWNDQSELGANWGASYQWSKAESERRAWGLSKELKVPMVSVCPSFVLGPPSSDDSNSYSITLVGQWVRGESDVQSRLCSDVRDVAKVHVAAGTKATAIGGRYIASTEARIPSQDIAKALQNICRSTGMGDPNKITFDGSFDGGAIKIGDKEVETAEQLKEDFGLEFRPVEETMTDMAHVLLGMERKD